MNILIRADGSLSIGLGHIFRCLTIANYFKKTYNNIEIYFLTQSSPEIQNKLLKDYVCIDPCDKSVVKNLVESSDIFISDMLDTNNILISNIKQMNPLIRVVCIDNNTELKYIESADVVFNANVFHNHVNHNKYHIGSDYMILREYFFLNHHESVSEDVNNVFISFGGSDEKGSTINVLNAFKTIEKEIEINVIAGPMFQFQEDIKKIASEDRRIKIIHEPDNIYELMNNADLAIIAAGITLYEVSSLGVPSIVIPQVEHQSDIAHEFDKEEVCINLGYNPTSEDIKTNVEKIINDKTLRKRLSANGKLFVDGKGLQRFMNIVMDDLHAKEI